MSRAARVLGVGVAFAAAATLAACHVSVKKKSDASDTAGSTAASSTAAPSAPASSSGGASGSGAQGIFANSKPITLPLVVTKSAGVETFVKLTIHDKPYYLNVDSGASTTSIDPTIAKQIGLKTLGAGPTFKTIGCTVKTKLVSLDDWSLGPVKLPTVKLPAQPNQYTKVKFGGIPVIGQLGSDLQGVMGRVTIDYTGKKVTFVAPAATGSKTVPLQLKKTKGVTDAVLAPVTIKSNKYVMQVDTGASHSTLSAAVASKLKLPKAGKPTKVSAVSCSTTVQPVKLSGVKIGGIPAPATVAATSSGASPNGGNIIGLFGSDLLSSYGTITIDYGASKLTLGS